MLVVVRVFGWGRGLLADKQKALASNGVNAVNMRSTGGQSRLFIARQNQKQRRRSRRATERESDNQHRHLAAGLFKSVSRPVGEVRGNLHHLSDGVGVGLGHGADVQAGVAVLLHLHDDTEAGHDTSTHTETAGIPGESHAPLRSSSGRCCSGGWFGRPWRRFPGRCTEGSSSQRFYPAGERFHRIRMCI